MRRRPSDETLTKNSYSDCAEWDDLKATATAQRVHLAGELLGNRSDPMGRRALEVFGTSNGFAFEAHRPLVSA